MLSLYADSARGQRLRGYPLCKESLDDNAEPLGQAFERSEDQLLAELFSSPVRIPALSIKDARKTFDRDVVPVMVQSYLASDVKSASASCRLGFKIFETIDQLPGKKRIKAYRALLTLPELPAG